MSKQINVNIRMDSETKERADRLFNELGFNLTTAINAFVKQALRERAIPFYITANELPPERGKERSADDEADKMSMDDIAVYRREKKNIVSRGRKLGRVLHVSEAFSKYPVEKEDHKGKPEYWTWEGEPE